MAVDERFESQKIRRQTIRAFRAVYCFWVLVGSRRRTSVVLVTTAGLLLGYILHLRHGFPDPAIHDEFSYLLAADTFASGRLTNPAHPLWTHFESMHIIQQPTYASIYPVAQGVVLGMAQRITGHPWWGVWFSVGLMCGAICWMLQQWLPPQWALVGGLFSLRAVLTYWLWSYWGGAVAATAGAVLLGAAARILRSPASRWASLMAVGIVILGNSRPYEGLVLTLSVGVWMVVRLVKMPPAGRVLVIRRAIIPFAVILPAAGAWMAYYNWRVTGSPITLPYQVSFQTYLYRRMFVWQKDRPKPPYRHATMEKAYAALERRDLTWEDGAYKKLVRPLLQYFWPPLLLLGLLAPLDWKSHRTGPLLVFSAVVFLALALEEWGNPHYSAPVAAALYGVMIQAFRRVNAWGRLGCVVAQALVVATLGKFLVTFAVHSAAAPDVTWGTDRGRIERQLEETPGRDLVIVRYSPAHDPFHEWVYNRADIDHAPVVWARDDPPTQQENLIRYFAGRRVWILEPDHAQGPLLRSYAPGSALPGVKDLAADRMQITSKTLSNQPGGQ